MNLKTIKEIQSKYESDLDALENLQFEKFCKEIQDFPDNFFISETPPGRIEVLRKKSDATSVYIPDQSPLNNYIFSICDDLYLDLKHYIRYKRRMGHTLPKQEEKKVGSTNFYQYSRNKRKDMTLDDYYKKMIQNQNEKTKHDKLFLDQFQASPDDFKVTRIERYTSCCYLITRKSDGYEIHLQSDHTLAPKLNVLIQVRDLERVQYVKGLFKKLQWWKK